TITSKAVNNSTSASVFTGIANSTVTMFIAIAALCFSVASFAINLRKKTPKKKEIQKSLDHFKPESLEKYKKKNDEIFGGRF
ncbi:hypothetical protein KJ780_00675, partial [Candidatus Micrarchaeota archaeon]|nr:hypothetical protein [Candidatus Micrarchaeota archaeon]